MPETDIILNKNIDEAFTELLEHIGNLGESEKERYKLYVQVNKDLNIDEKDISIFTEKVQQKIDNISHLDDIYKDLLQVR